MAQTPVVWSDAIGVISDEFKNAVIDILDPSLVTSTYDAETDNYTQTGNPTIVSGVAARIQPFRAQVNVASGAIRNPSGDVRMRIQIPRTSVSGRIKRGWQILVTTAERNPELAGYALNVDAVVNSSWRASITMECSVNVESEEGWTL